MGYLPDPGPCPVDETPHTACCTTPYTVDEAGRISPGLGGVIVIRQCPQRDEAAGAAPVPTVPLSAAHVKPPPSRPAPSSSASNVQTAQSARPRAARK